MYGVPEKRVRVVGSGYNDELFNPTGRTPHVEGAPAHFLYVGKI